MKKILEALGRIWYFLMGFILSKLYYDSKYLQGEWFQGSHGIVLAPGWRWVYVDGFSRLLKGSGKGIPWPVAPTCQVVGWQNIEFDAEDLRNFQGIGNYFQAIGAKITIGRGTWIAPGAGIITSNHDLNDPDKRQAGQNVILGEKCWIGMNAVILPGVTLGNHTVVGAGAVVTKSFPQGHCVIGGNPAKIIKYIENDQEDNYAV